MKLLPFLSLLLIYSSCKNANPDLQNEKEVRKALANKWQSAYIETMGNRGKVPDAQIEVITINENGTFSAGAKDGIVKQNGKWNYDPKKQMIYMGVGDQQGPSKINKLTDKELIITGYILSNDKIMDSIVMTYNKL